MSSDSSCNAHAHASQEPWPEDVGHGSILRTSGGLSPFPVSRPRWLVKDDWKCADIPREEMTGTSGISDVFWDAVADGRKLLDELSCTWMPPLQNFDGMQLEQSTSDGMQLTLSGHLNADSLTNAVSIDIYVDGSGEHEGSPGATWAFAVLAEGIDRHFSVDVGHQGAVKGLKSQDEVVPTVIVGLDGV